jgi:YD repeat-containing protein
MRLNVSHFLERGILCMASLIAFFFVASAALIPPIAKGAETFISPLKWGFPEGSPEPKIYSGSYSYESWIYEYIDPAFTNGVYKLQLSSASTLNSPDPFSFSDSAISSVLQPRAKAFTTDFGGWAASLQDFDAASTIRMKITPSGFGIECYLSNGTSNLTEIAIPVTGATLTALPFNYEADVQCVNLTDSPLTISISDMYFITRPISPPTLSDYLQSLNLSFSADGFSIFGPDSTMLVFNGAPFDTNTPYCPWCGQPVNTVNGSLWHKFTDFTVAGRTPDTKLELTRTYLSRPVLPGGDFGPHWFHNWETQILAVDSSTTPNLAWIDQSGGTWIFKRTSAGTYANPPGFFGSLFETDTDYTLNKTHGVTYHFSKDASIAPLGRLVSLVERHGETVTLSYDPNGKLSAVNSPFAGSISFARNSSGNISQVLRQRDGLAYNYTYDSLGRLQSSADFDANTTQYGYALDTAGAIGTGLLSSIRDPLGRVSTNTYDLSTGTIISQTEPGLASRNFYFTKDTSGNEYGFIYDIACIVPIHVFFQAPKTAPIRTGKYFSQYASTLCGRSFDWIPVSVRSLYLPHFI